MCIQSELWMRILYSLFLSLLFLKITIPSENINLIVDVNTIPEILAAKGCQGKRISCYHLAHPLIAREKEKLFNIPLEGWKYSEICR